MTPVSLARASRVVADADPAVKKIVELVGPIRSRPRDPDGGFAALVRAITFQQLAGRAAVAIHGRLRALVDGEFGPAAVLALTDEQMRGAGLSRAKIAALRDLAAKVLDGTVVLSPRTTMSDEEIISRLSTVRGIGRWTAEMYLIFQLRRLDVWPVDDLGVRQGYARIFGLDAAPTARELQPLGDRFRPYRSVLALYCWQAAALAPGGTSAELR
ncbi:MAG TPA: DNA-3-methyladenine glycosylase 2 family protein [Asanoa sp.]